MDDIRIINGKRIVPSMDDVAALLGDRHISAGESLIQEAFQELLMPLQMRICPKAAFTISCKEGCEPLLYVMLTIGDGVNRLMERYRQKNEILKVMTLDAMADSSLFVFEDQLLASIRQICGEEGYVIAKRLEIERDMLIDTQKEIYEAVAAGRTLGISMTSGYMLDPVKSMSMCFALACDGPEGRLKHDCNECGQESCLLRQRQEALLEVWEPESNTRKTQIRCQKGSGLLSVLQEHNICLYAYCGGKGACGKCGVRLKQGELPITARDRAVFSDEELHSGMRLSCQAVLQENIAIFLPERNNQEPAALGSRIGVCVKSVSRQSDPKEGYGIAVDLGTTTLAFSLYDLQSGKVVDTVTSANSQRVFGADVISRIQAANAGAKDKLCQSVRQDLVNGMRRLIEASLPKSGAVRRIAIAANTVMLHLLRGYSCEGFSSYPFVPKTLALEEISFAELFGAQTVLPGDVNVTLLPGISAFVGADITAGLYACGAYLDPDPFLFLDIGTNGEMALSVDGKIFVASTAAGPAFEGANIQWGMPSIPGAISQVALQDQMPAVKTIGNQPPSGICGTGLVEAAAELLSAGILDQSGKLSEPYFSEGFPLAKSLQGKQIVLTQQDIRQLQLAKAAIRAGLDILCLRSGVSIEKIAHIYLAGGFGYYLDIKKAAAIGIFPKEWSVKATAAGNTALDGALLFLAEQNPHPLQKIARSAIEIPLAEDEMFEEWYLRDMLFER